MKTVRFWVAESRRRLISRIGSRPMALGKDTTFVSFCFDDFPRTALKTGGGILQAYGARGTFYAAPGLMGVQNELGEQFQREDLDAVLSEGHELGCHTFQHLSCRSATRADFEADVQKGRKVIHRMTGHDPVNFAYPYGHVTMAVKKKLGAQMCTCRGIFAGVNKQVADRNLLRANSLYGDVGESAAVDKLLEESEAGDWLIFYTHDVREKPSPFGCTPALFKEAVARTLNKGFTIAPVAEVIAAAERRLSDQPLNVDRMPDDPGGTTTSFPSREVKDESVVTRKASY